jgi:uncharacterized membrane protein
MGGRTTHRSREPGIAPSPVDATITARIVMRAGLAVAFSLLVIGTLILALEGAAADAVRATQLLSGPSIGDRVLMLGVLVLALTPAVQVLVLVIGWWRMRDYRYAAVAGAVMALLAAAVVLGIAG